MIIIIYSTAQKIGASMIFFFYKYICLAGMH